MSISKYAATHLCKPNTSLTWLVWSLWSWVAWKQTPVIRSTAYNLLLQWMEYLLLQMPLVEPKCDFVELCQNISISLIRKSLRFDWSFSRIPVHIVSYELWYTGSAITICIVVTKYYCIAIYQWIVTSLVTGTFNWRQHRIKCFRMNWLNFVWKLRIWNYYISQSMSCPGDY